MTTSGARRDTEEPRVPLRERPWFIAVMLFVFFPVGLVMFWRHEAWGWVTKWVVTIAVFVGVFVALDRLGL